MKIKQPKEELQSIEDYIRPFRDAPSSSNISSNTSSSPSIPSLDTRQTPKLEAALERAWKNRDFEIDKYWSRATYFWAFIASAFAGYLGILASDKIEVNLKQTYTFMLACIGLIFSVAWIFVNKGSKKWQENWEKHIDMLEDYVTGPIYKTTITERGYSVSKINLRVSEFIFGVWAILFIKDIAPWGSTKQWEFSLLKCLFLLLTLWFIIRIVLQHDKGRKEEKGFFSFYRRRNEEVL